MIVVHTRQAADHAFFGHLKIEFEQFEVVFKGFDGMVADEFVAFSRLEGVEGSPVGQHEFVGVTVHTDPI